MKKIFLPMFLCVGLALSGCSDTAAILENLDLDTQERIDAMVECFPANAEKVAALFAIAHAWATTEDAPAGLDTTLNGNQIDVVTFVPSEFGSCRITMTITFHDPSGGLVTAQDLGLDQVADPTDLDDLMDAAVTELGTKYPGQQPYVHATWNISTGVVSEGPFGEGAFTGIIGGSTNENELEEIRTTVGEPPVGGGTPPVGPGVVSAAPDCSLEFTTVGIRTDDIPGQEYPSGVITISLFTPAINLNGTITMDATVIAIIRIDGIPGTFSFNLDTFAFTGPNL